MNILRLSKVLAGGFCLFLINVLFLYLDIYWIFPWADMVMHFLGGFLLALIPLSLTFPKGKSELRRASVILTILAVSILWEWYERLLGLSKPLIFSLYDTTTDIVSALLGSSIAYYLISKKK